MKTRLFYTTGNQDIIETTWDKPEPGDDQIEVKSIYTGVCRSDIDMYVGKFTLPSIYMQGHEGLGQVTKVGKKIKEIRLIEVGQYVATRGEPAFSDYYNVNQRDFVEIGMYADSDDLSPRYIIEPVACGVNLVAEAMGLKRFQRQNPLTLTLSSYSNWQTVEEATPKDIMILGTGFLATVVYATLRENHPKLNITVIGKANQDFWISESVRYLTDIDELEDEEYDVIFDISEKARYVAPSVKHLANAGTLVVAAEKKPNVPYPTAELLWKSAKVIYPSPRSKNFQNVMAEAMNMVDYGQVHVDDLWTQAYDRDTEVKQAFEDGLNRKSGYARGYIKW